MKEYFKMKDVFAGKVKEGLTVNGPSIHGDNHAFYANTKDRRIAVYAAHAINSHDELVAEVERLTKSAELAIMTLEEVDRVLTERIKNGAYDLDDISGEVTYALDKISARE